MAIRQLYLPIQPLTNRSGADILYQELLPDNRLQQYIYYYWELKTKQTLKQAFDYRIVADGCIDVFFEINNPQENFVMGFSNSFTEFQLSPSFHYIGVRFLPTMFPQIFNIKASELSNRCENLDQVFPKTHRFIADNFRPELSTEEINTLLNRHFLQLTANTGLKLDSRLYEAIHIILKKAGSLHVETELKTGVSSRQLRRLFEFYVGDTPKAFSKVVRFQNILQGKPSTQSLRESKVFFDAGYYDQTHFIKEFKSFYGDTPANALRK